MGLLQTLKTLLGLDGGTRRQSEPEITVERRPSTETEDAVKGTEDAPRAPQSPGTIQSGEAGGDDAVPTIEESTGTDEAEPAPDTESAGSEASEDIATISGIGPTYSERLSDAGIGTVADLADADADAVAEAAETSPSRARDWIDQARDR